MNAIKYKIEVEIKIFSYLLLVRFNINSLAIFPVNPAIAYADNANSKENVLTPILLDIASLNVDQQYTVQIEQ
jgi:hypothetical protein